MKIKLIQCFLLLCSGLAYGQTMGTMTDPRDRNTYKTVSYSNGDTWIAENLHYRMPGAFPFEFNPEYEWDYGLLYTWEDAIKACPEGWHLPSDEEWNKLVKLFGGYEKAGPELKSKTGWELDNTGTNRSGFNGQPAGFRSTPSQYDPEGSFLFRGKIGYYWTSTQVDGKHAWVYKLENYRPLVDRYEGKMGLSLSCRCVQD
jgi:uncharacterized protein (TIGR02145 family)